MTVLIYAIVAGLFGIGGGLLAWRKSSVISKAAAHSFNYFRHRTEEDKFQRINNRLIRVIAAAWILAGLGVIAYHVAKVGLISL